MGDVDSRYMLHLMAEIVVIKLAVLDSLFRFMLYFFVVVDIHSIRKKFQQSS